MAIEAEPVLREVARARYQPEVVGKRAWAVDGNDLLAVHDATRRARARAAAGEGPTLLEFVTSIGDRWARGLDPTSTGETYGYGLKLRVLPAVPAVIRDGEYRGVEELHKPRRDGIAFGRDFVEAGELRIELIIDLTSGVPELVRAGAGDPKVFLDGVSQ